MTSQAPKPIPASSYILHAQTLNLSPVDQDVQVRIFEAAGREGALRVWDSKLGSMKRCSWHPLSPFSTFVWS